MKLKNLNLNLLRIFVSVYRTRSMTLAAAELALTQSGVSQHMKTLEESIQKKLFDRMGAGLMPTPDADLLFAKCSVALEQLEALFEGETQELRGRLTIGAPVAFGNHILVPMVASLAEKNPGLQFDLRYDFAKVHNEQLLRGELDLAFVDEFEMDSQVHIEDYFSEELEMCYSARSLWARGRNLQDVAVLREIPFVDYQPDGPFVRRWLSHHFRISKFKAELRAHVMSVRGVAALVSRGVGAGVIPRHLIETLQREGMDLIVIPGRSEPLTNKIRMAFLKDRTQSPQLRAVIDYARAQRHAD